MQKVANANVSLVITDETWTKTVSTTTIATTSTLANHHYLLPHTCLKPDCAGAYKVELTVDDGCLSKTASATINVVCGAKPNVQIDSSATLGRDLRIDGANFTAGTPVRFRYGFPFFRGAWAYDVLPAPDRELAFGVGLQLRNASIEFESVDGRSYRQRNDVGPVPLLRARGRFPISTRGFFGFEIDGLYAPISVLNGSDNEVAGAILDASVRVGWRVIPHVEAFINVRYLGGGAVGQGDPTNTSDGYQSNWLHFTTVSLGTTLDSRI